MACRHLLIIALLVLSQTACDLDLSGIGEGIGEGLEHVDDFELGPWRNERGSTGYQREVPGVEHTLSTPRFSSCRIVLFFRRAGVVRDPAIRYGLEQFPLSGVPQPAAESLACEREEFF